MKSYFSWAQTGGGGDRGGWWLGCYWCVDFGLRIWCCFSIYLIDFQMFKTDKFVLELVFLWLELYTLAATNFL